MNKCKQVVDWDEFGADIYCDEPLGPTEQVCFHCTIQLRRQCGY